MVPVTSCAVCGGRDLRPHALSEWREGILHFAQARCAGCGLIISQPRATADEIDRYYRDEYYARHWPDGNRIVNNNRPIYARHEVPEMQRLWRDWPPPEHASIFEVGCGYGTFLMMMADAGHRVAGCEISTDAVRFCREHGLDVQQAALSGIKVAEPVDVAVSQQVIEHVEDPRAFVRAMVRLTRPGGIVAIVTEDAANTARAIQLAKARLRGRIPPFHTSNDHTFVFLASHLERLLREAGCDEVRTASFSYVGEGESLHWRLYKMTLRGIDRLAGHGDYLMAVGRVGTSSIT